MRHLAFMAFAMLAATGTSPALARSAPFQLHHTTWTYVDPGARVKAIESIDTHGNYIENAVSGKHLDHGTAVMRRGKLCSTSAMTKAGEVCWTVRPVAVGQSIVAVNDAGMKLRVTRVKYRAMSIRK